MNLLFTTQGDLFGIDRMGRVFQNGDRQLFNSVDAVLRFFHNCHEFSHTLRSVLSSDCHVINVYSYQDYQVLQEIARRVYHGELEIVKLAERPRGIRSRNIDWPQFKPIKYKPLLSRQKLTWIEIELVDEENHPIPNEEYKIILPNGNEVEGTLDENGLARVDGIEEVGNCQVTFPKLDKAMWEKD